MAAPLRLPQPWRMPGVINLPRSTLNPVVLSDIILTLRIFNTLIVTDWLHNRQRVLEIGCSMQRIAADILFPLLWRRTKAVESLDSCCKQSYEMEERGPEYVCYKMGSCGSYSFTYHHRKKFHSIYSFFHFHLVPDTSKWMLGVRKILKINGQFLFTFMVNTACQKALRLQSRPGCIWSQWMGNPNSAYANYSSNPERYFNRYLDSFGMILVIMEPPRPVICPSLFDAVAISLHAHPFINNIPDELYWQYVEDFSHLIRDVSEVQGGGYEVYQKIVVVGRRLT